MFFKFFYIFTLFLTALWAKDGYPDTPYIDQQKTSAAIETQEKITSLEQEEVVDGKSTTSISVVGSGVAPSYATSPAQAYVLAKRAATADGYRLLAEKIKGVQVEGKETIENMIMKDSQISSKVSAMIKNATIVDTKFQNGLCEVTMEIEIHPDDL